MPRITTQETWSARRAISAADLEVGSTWLEQTWDGSTCEDSSFFQGPGGAVKTTAGVRRYHSLRPLPSKVVVLGPRYLLHLPGTQTTLHALATFS